MATRASKKQKIKTQANNSAHRRSGQSHEMLFEGDHAARRPRGWKCLKLVNLRYTTGDGRRWQTVCDKRDNNFVWTKVPPNFTFLLSRFISVLKTRNHIVKWRLRQNTQAIAMSRTQAFWCPLLSQCRSVALTHFTFRTSQSPDEICFLFLNLESFLEIKLREQIKWV